MATLGNLRNSLRFSLELAALESGVAPPREGSPRPGLSIVGAPASVPRLLASVSMDFFDKKDREFWPFVRQAVLWLGPGDADDLVGGLEKLLRDELAGFAFRSGSGELGLQLGKVQAETAAATTYAVEIGLDLATVLDEAAGTGHEAGDALSLFRFATGRPQLVAFGQALRDELLALTGAERAERAAKTP
ncbi:MAG TPA: hypothetical protein VMB50_03345 [Myxococcales bacterium]|nr:hypothetical protein [Myxococcales bacterium]